MKGGIYSNQKCPVCRKNFKHFEPRGIWCETHPQYAATKFIVRFKDITRNLPSYEAAYRFLTGLRYETDMGKFDLRDYKTDQPLGFANLAIKFLESKRHNKAIKKYEQRLRFGIKKWENRSVTTFTKADLEELLNELRDEKRSTKYIKVINDTLRMFWTWLLECEEIRHDQLPKFPKVSGSMAFRRVIKKDVQISIIEKVREMTFSYNPRIYAGICILATYPKIRPGELVKIKERYFDPEMGRLYITDPKEGRPKYIALIPEDVTMLKSLGRSFPETHIFRHVVGRGGNPPNSPFGPNYLYHAWRDACEELGVEGVPLYPGTKHSTVIFMRNEAGLSKSECQEATGHGTNSAFERYYEIEDETLRKLYSAGTGKVKGKKLIRLRNVAEKT